MAYRTMKSIFHEGKVPLEDELARRLALPETIPLGFALEEDELFFTMASDVYQLLLEAARLDKEIAVLTRSLSQRALQQYRESLLIDEIVLTNDIEGIYSTRKEIYEVMESLKRNCGKGRFLGLVRKYTMLSSQQEIPLSTCEDIRALYDELVLDEVAREKAGNRPDGRIFRAGKVNIYDGGGKAIHSGVYPEKRIVELLEKSLPEEEENEIRAVILKQPGCTDPHNLRTRRIGNYCAIDVHFRMDGRTTIDEAHRATREIEDRLRERFGPQTLINTHVEPIKHPARQTDTA